MTLLNRLKTVVTNGTEPDTATTVSSSLYRCPTCDTTYIAIEMESCQSCDASVDEVPSKLV